VKVLLIGNPGAGGAAGARGLAELVRGKGHEVREQSLKDDGWQRALDAPLDLVAVAGGDGTVGRVAKALAGRNLPIAPLPAGTANNIAHALGLCGRPYEELVHGWGEARRMKLDIGEVRGPWGSRYVVEGIGAGLFARAIPMVEANQTMATLARSDAKVAYALQMLKERIENCRAVRIEATLDGEDVSGEYLLFEALFMPYVGPNLRLAPDSQPGDGCFELVMVTAEERARVQQYIASWQEEKPRVAVLPSRQGRNLQMRWSGFEIHIDDELWPSEGEQPPAAPIQLSLTDIAVEFLVTEPTKKR
jgi:diacylglycerol kinase (ATP)